MGLSLLAAAAAGKGRRAGELPAAGAGHLGFGANVSSSSAAVPRRASEGTQHSRCSRPGCGAGKKGESTRPGGLGGG